MSHELSIRANGFVEMAYSGAVPWHGLGQTVNPDASIEEWQQASGLDWTARRSSVRYATALGDLRVWKDNVVLFRSDSLEPLAIVSDTYKLVQPSECLEFFRDLVTDAGFRIVTAGALKGGRKIWAQAEIGAKEAVVAGDAVRGMVLIATSLDGSMNTVVKHVSERVVCANTLGYALKEGGKQVRISHRSTFNAADVKAELGLSLSAFHRFMNEMRMLSRVTISHQSAVRNFAKVLKVDPTVKDYKVTPQEPLSNVIRLYDGEGKGSRMPGVSGTAWGWLNAVTEYVDHHARARSVDNRIDSAWFGRGEAIKQEAYETALEMAA